MAGARYAFAGFDTDIFLRDYWQNSALAQQLLQQLKPELKVDKLQSVATLTKAKLLLLALLAVVLS